MTIASSIITALTASGLPPDGSISTTTLPSIAFSLGASTPLEYDGDFYTTSLTITVNAPNQSQCNTIMSKCRTALTNYSDDLVTSIPSEARTPATDNTTYWQGSLDFAVTSYAPVSRRHDARGKANTGGTASYSLIV